MISDAETFKAADKAFTEKHEAKSEVRSSFLPSLPSSTYRTSDERRTKY